MTILSTLLQRGYFPKELPPSFFTDEFARFASSKDGRAAIRSYTPIDKFTDCVTYNLALPGLIRRRLRIPHPASFAQLSVLASKHFKRLLARAGRSQFSRSRPVYGTDRHRAIHTSFSPANLPRERATIRSSASYLLKADVGDFYPSLYTHAVGWAVDPRMRQKANWHNHKLLGKQVDQALMDLQRKISQGLPIGNDISFLLAEVVLAQIDVSLKLPKERCYRWFDDYEIACDTREEAERVLALLSSSLHSYSLRLNPRKTHIHILPQPSQELWQQDLLRASAVSFKRAADMVQYFDMAFQLRTHHPDAPILVYTLAVLFRLPKPTNEVLRVAVSGITQALLCEPGSAQKAFALLTFWKLNGCTLDLGVLARTVDEMIRRHRTSGVTSDIAWALFFCIQHAVKLTKASASTLSAIDDDCITLQALHMNAEGLFTGGFSHKRIASSLNSIDLDGQHWLLGYETVRQGFRSESAPAVAGNPLFSAMLARKVTFYRRTLPAYAPVVHPGGAPEWLLVSWLRLMTDPRRAHERDEQVRRAPVLGLIWDDLDRLHAAGMSRDNALRALIGIFQAADFDARFGDFEPYT